jgi:hypothetical protein
MVVLSSFQLHGVGTCMAQSVGPTLDNAPTSVLVDCCTVTDPASACSAACATAWGALPQPAHVGCCTGRLQAVQGRMCCRQAVQGQFRWQGCTCCACDVGELM